jgi:5,10-methylene-tetrahydrofolate dehydrogenase/methenyl tetrahydrofolate cyclohydrolase
MSLILDGNHAASAIKHKVREAIAESGTQPRLAVVLVGHDPASKIYVRNKAKDCEQCGIDSVTYVLPEDTSEEKLVELIRSLSNDDSVHGILVQLPLPKHINKDHVISAIKPEKDVDVGMNRDKDGKLCGDCNPEAYERSSAYTPVPGGVGPMTRAMLLLNAVTAAGLKVRLDW